MEKREEHKQVTGTLVNYYHVCLREMWLHANDIKMEHNSELVADGKFIHETSYERRADKFREIQFGPVKIDYYDPETKTIHETKRSASVEQAQEWQLKYYIHIMEQYGVEGVEGLLEYPESRKTRRIILTDDDRSYLESIIPIIRKIINQDNVPQAKRIPFCKSCSFHDLCWIKEEEEDQK